MRRTADRIRAPGGKPNRSILSLIIVACVASGDLVSHIQIHMHAAQKAGATPEEIMEALNFVGSWIGVRRLLGLGGLACHVPPRPPHD